ncbi:MAG TPA: hypothetical protein VJZ27_17960 [Aggregatilineales bacterium]|nr:hypothetical protein [Aggregatilineales bacterium]
MSELPFIPKPEGDEEEANQWVKGIIGIGVLLFVCICLIPFCLLVLIPILTSL